MRTLLRWFVACLMFLPLSMRNSRLVTWCLGVVPASEERVVSLCSVGAWIWGAVALMPVAYGFVAAALTPTQYTLLAVVVVVSASLAWACWRRAHRPA